MLLSLPMLKRALTWGLCCAFALLHAHTATAQNQVAAAEALFKAAKALAKEGKWAQACPKFEASQKLDKQLGTLTNIADCYENLGKVATAWARWNAALEWARHNNDERLDYIHGRQKKIEPRLPKVVVNVANPVSTLSIKRGSVEVAEPMWGVPIPVDADPIEVTVLRGQTVLLRHPIEPQEGEISVVTIDLANIDRTHPAPPPSAEPITPPPTPPPPYDPTQRNVGLIVGGIGIVAVLVAAGLEVGALVKKGQADESDACVNRFCSPDGLDAAESGATFAEVGQWVGIGGLATLAVGVTIFLTAPSEQPPASARAGEVQAAPWISPQAGGMSVGGVF